MTPAALARPRSGADHHTWELAERYLASQQAPNAITLSEDVTRLITTLLPTAQCTSAAIASHLSMHKRTLQRRLANEGVSYEQLLEEVRLKLLREYLMEPNLKLSQVAGLPMAKRPTRASTGTSASGAFCLSRSSRLARSKTGRIAVSLTGAPPGSGPSVAPAACGRP